jgi:hypothetical protein
MPMLSLKKVYRFSRTDLWLSCTTAIIMGEHDKVVLGDHGEVTLKERLKHYGIGGGYVKPHTKAKKYVVVLCLTKHHTRFVLHTTVYIGNGRNIDEA